MGTALQRDYDFSHWDDLPAVSCQCITYGRPALLNEAVESFIRQDYPGTKELVVLNDHHDIVLDDPGIPNVLVVNVGRRFRTIGEKRNACCGLCSGDLIFPWDDDDISLPWRLSLSVERMVNHHYFKPDRLWYWARGSVSVKKTVGHAMGAWSREMFNDVGGYPHIQSGQDQAIEDLFRKTGNRAIEEVVDEELFYLYRFPGTGSYHLSAHGYGMGYEAAENYVNKRVKAGVYTLAPSWAVDYAELVATALGNNAQSSEDASI